MCCVCSDVKPPWVLGLGGRRKLRLKEKLLDFLARLEKEMLQTCFYILE